MARTRFSGPVISDNGFEGQFTATSIQLESDNGNKILVDAPDSLAADYTLILPPNDGDNGQVLTTDGSGVTTWTTNGVGTVTSVALSGGTTGLTVSGSPVTASGTITLAGVLGIANGGTNIGTVGARNGPGAVDLTSLVTAVTGTGAADALTLADGTVGQIKTIVYVAESDAGDASVLTPATPLGFLNLTFAAVGDTATLVYTSAGWAIVAVRGTNVA